MMIRNALSIILAFLFVNFIGCSNDSEDANIAQVERQRQPGAITRVVVGETSQFESSKAYLVSIPFKIVPASYNVKHNTSTLTVQAPNGLPTIICILNGPVDSGGRDFQATYALQFMNGGAVAYVSDVAKGSLGLVVGAIERNAVDQVLLFMRAQYGDAIRKLYLAPNQECPEFPSSVFEKR